MALRKTLESQSFLVIANVLTGILSIVILGLVGHNLSYVRSSSAQKGFVDIVYNVTVNATTIERSQGIALLPEDVRLGSYWLMLAAGIGGFIDAVLLAVTLSWRKLSIWKSESQPGEEAPDINLVPQTPLSIVIATFSLCRSLAATIYAFYEWAASGTFDPQEALPLVNGRYSSSGGIFFTPDAWNCQLEDYIPIEALNNPLEMLCNEGTATRTVTLALTVLATVVLGCILWRSYLRRRHARADSGGKAVDSAEDVARKTMSA